MVRAEIFHPDFKPLPYWWEAYRPVSGDLAEVPRTARVAIVADNHRAWVDCYYGGPRAGLIVTPINQRLSPPRQ